jgi:hypothetical protein
LIVEKWLVTFAASRILVEGLLGLLSSNGTNNWKEYSSVTVKKRRVCYSLYGFTTQKATFWISTLLLHRVAHENVLSSDEGFCRRQSVTASSSYDGSDMAPWSVIRLLTRNKAPRTKVADKYSHNSPSSSMKILFDSGPYSQLNISRKIKTIIVNRARFDTFLPTNEISCLKRILSPSNSFEIRHNEGRKSHNIYNQLRISYFSTVGTRILYLTAGMNSWNTPLSKSM